MFWFIFLTLTAAFIFGHWYRGLHHNIEVSEQDGEHLGG
jgi:hypothetical protein